MTQRQPPRRRRRNVPAASLPRPVATGEERSAGPEQRPSTMATHAAATARQAARPREHHVQQDFSYVPRELAVVGAVSAVTLGFIVLMYFVL